jgi:hypothetical protein
MLKKYFALNIFLKKTANIIFTEYILPYFGIKQRYNGTN